MHINSISTKYHTVSQYYIDQIESGELKDGQQLPTEVELCSLFGVSRVTIRKALDDLALQGYIVKKHSKGSFVRFGTSNMCLNNLYGFTDEMAHRGLSATAQLIQLSLENAGSFIATKLNIAEQSKVYIIERLRIVENEPMAIEKMVLPYFYCPDMGKQDLSQSVYRLLEHKYGLRLAKADEILEASLAEKREADILAIPKKAPVLRIERIGYLANHVPLEYTVSIYRGDKYKFYVTMNK